MPRGPARVAVPAVEPVMKDERKAKCQLIDELAETRATLASLAKSNEDLRRAIEGLKESEEWFRNIFSQSPIGVELYDSDARLVGINKACLDIFGVSNPEDIRAPRLFDEPNMIEVTRSKLRQGETVRFEFPFDLDKARRLGWYKTGKPGVAYLDVLISPLGFEEKRGAKGYLVQVQDITERKRAQDQLRDLSRRLVEVQEQERNRVARELHDQIGQILTGLKLLIDMAVRSPSSSVRSSLGEAQALVNDLMAKVHDMSLDLRPSMLDDLGLIPTLLWHFERYTAQTNVKVAFRHGRSIGRFPTEVETTSYRIVQEALTNVARHAGVDQVEVRLLTADSALVIEIKDNGGGFDAKAVLTSGASRGLIGMRERAALLGGVLTVASTPGEGTCLRAELPLHEPGRNNPGSSAVGV